MARALVLLAAGLLAVPGLFVLVKGVATLRRRATVVQGRTVTGAAAIGAGFVLIAWGLGMIAVAALVLAAQGRR